MKIDLVDTVFYTGFVACAGFVYGVLCVGNGLKTFEQAAEHGLPTTAAKAFAISSLAFDVISTTIKVTVDAHLLDRRYEKFAASLAITVWGGISIAAFRQLNLIAGTGTAVLTGFLALKSLQILAT